MQKIKGKQQWTQEQRKLLSDLFPKFSSKKWKMISMEMGLKGFKRTQLECREKWINFLDPTLNNEDWSPQELYKLYNFHDKYGTRWCFMQKELNRTQNRIKNRFYGTIRNYIRLVMNTLCQRQTCFNTEINKISPSLLNDLYNSENIFDFLGGQIKKMIYRMKFRIEKKTLRNRIKEKQHLYRQLLGLIGSLFKGSFSLKFIDIIDQFGGDNEEQEYYSLKIFQGQKTLKNIKQPLVNIQKNDKKIEKKGQVQLQASQLHSLNEKRQLFQQDLKKQDHQYIEIKQPQSLNASYNTFNLKQQFKIEDINKPLNQPAHSQSNLIYPFLEQHHVYATHQQWLLNHAFRQQMHQQLEYEFMIQKIRQQNLSMMRQQQEFILSQNGENHDAHNIFMNMYRH